MHYIGAALVSSIFVLAASLQVSAPERLPAPAIAAMQSASAQDILQHLRQVRADIAASEQRAPQSP